MTLRVPATISATFLSALVLGGCQPVFDPRDHETIPATVQGMWGMTANDCVPIRDDANRLTVVTVTALTVYKARAKLAKVTVRKATRIAATYDFSGEGQTWRRHITLDVLDAGETLIRRDIGNRAIPEPLRYLNCAMLLESRPHWTAPKFGVITRPCRFPKVRQ